MTDQHRDDGAKTPNSPSPGDAPEKSTSSPPRRTPDTSGKAPGISLSAASVEEHLVGGAPAGGSRAGADGGSGAGAKGPGKPGGKATGTAKKAAADGGSKAAGAAAAVSAGAGAPAGTPRASGSATTAQPSTGQTSASASASASEGQPDTVSTTPGTRPASTRLGRGLFRSRTAASGDEQSAEKPAAGEQSARAGATTVAATVAAPGVRGATAAATAANGGRTGPGGDDGTPGRPKKPALAGAAMAGAVLIAIPLLIVAVGSDDDKDAKKDVAASSSADTVLDDENDGKAGAFVPESPSPTKTKSEEKKEKEAKEPAGAPAAAPHTSAAAPSPAAEKKASPVRKKAPSSLPSVLTRVLIKNNTNRTCVDIPGYSNGTTNGPIHQSGCNNDPNDNQLWDLEKRYESAGPGGAPLFQIRNVMDRMCLDLPGYAGVGPGTNVTESPCDGTKADNQLWWLDRQSDGKYWIRNFAGNNMCLDSWDTFNENRNLFIGQCSPEDQNNHQWIFTRNE